MKRGVVDLLSSWSNVECNAIEEVFPAPVKAWQMRHMLASHLESSRWSSWCYSGASCWKMLPGISNCHDHLLFLSWLLFSPKNTHTHRTLILPKWIDATVPPSLPPLPLLHIHLLSLLPGALFTPRARCSPLSSSPGASIELAVVTRLMDDSESGMGGWGEKTRRQGQGAPCNHYMDADVPMPQKTSSRPPSCACTACVSVTTRQRKSIMLERPDNDLNMLSGLQYNKEFSIAISKCKAVESKQWKYLQVASWSAVIFLSSTDRRAEI